MASSERPEPPVYLPQAYPLWVCWLSDPRLLGSARVVDRVIGWSVGGLVFPILAQVMVMLDTEEHYLFAYGESEDEARQRLERAVEEHRDDIHLNEG